MDENSENGPIERQFLCSRHTIKSGKELSEASGRVPQTLTISEKEQYFNSPDKDTPITYEKVSKKGEIFNVHPEPVSNPVQFNQQIEDSDLAVLKGKCSKKQFTEAVRMLPEFNFSTEEALKQVKCKSRPSPCFECGVAGCLRLQERWQGRVLHGCYPNEPLLEFQHEKSDLLPSCYFVHKKDGSIISSKFQDIRKDFNYIERQLT